MIRTLVVGIETAAVVIGGDGRRIIKIKEIAVENPVITVDKEIVLDVPK